MFQRNVPDREGFKFCIACVDTTFVFMVELGKAGSHFAASRSRCGYNNQRTGGFNIFVLAVAFVADNERNVAWITGNGIMQIYTDSQVFQLGFKSHGAGLTGKLCDDNAAYEKASVLKGIH